jgi:predicted O-linked N-acetylglucosamine transferase (SPINDLY family)
MPDDGGLHIFHARCLMALKEFRRAVAPCERAVALLPDSAEAHYLRGACLKRSGNIERAALDLQHSLDLAPGLFQAWNDRADIYVTRGAVPHALHCWRQSLESAPYNLDAMSSLCFYTAFDAQSDAKAFFDLKRDWGQRLVAQSAPGMVVPTAPPRPDGRLRIGYLAHDLGEGVTARFLEPVLARHDRTRFHITGYFGDEDKEPSAGRMGGYTDSWRDISADTPEGTVAKIQRDEIDILVLASSYRGKDLRVPARRPAPVQVCYLNRVASTGLETMDYLITDETSDPQGRVEEFYTESLVRISNHSVYRPPADAPAPRPLPCLDNGYITFGSFNNHAKITDQVIVTWSKILDEIPNSRLILRSSGHFDDAATRNRLRDKFIARGIDGARLDFQGKRPTQSEHLAGLLEADIALDPFPFNGGTTSCEALWVGLPVISFTTDSFIGRQGLRCLTRTGIADLASDSEEHYVANAVRLATDRDRLAELRATLPARVKSGLFDYDQHIQELEIAYRYMWSRHCDGDGPVRFSVGADGQIQP